MDHVQLARVARRQHGLFTRRQALACGYSYYQIRRRIDSGHWTVVAAAVLAPAGLELTARVRDRAEQLSVPGSILAGPAAARCWDMPCGVEDTYLFVGGHGPPRRGRARLLYEWPDRREIGTSADGALITSRARTVVDLLRLVPPATALDVLDRALQKGWLSVEGLANWVGGHTGCRGAKRLSRLVGLVQAGNRSACERRMAVLLQSAGIAGWQANLPIPDLAGLIGLGDFVFGSQRVVVECDGWAFHVTPEQFQRDRARQNRLVAAGWTVLRFTWRDLVERPDHVVTTIRAILARRSVEAR